MTSQIHKSAKSKIVTSRYAYGIKIFYPSLKMFLFQSNTAMETFRHIRENHLTEIKKLNIKIGKPLEPLKMKAFRRPGPKSRTRIGYKKADDISAKTSEVNKNQFPLNEIPSPGEEMDFESAINSIQEISKNTETKLILTGSETKITL